MDKTITALGLMSGTSMDGIDASLLRSDGEKNIDLLGNLFIKYDSELKNKLQNFTNNINSITDLNKNLDVKWNWVKAHAGNMMNEKVDLLAKKAASLN